MFKATAKDGKILWDSDIEYVVQDRLNHLEGECIIVEIKKFRERRTIPQNRLYWLTLAWFQETTGNEKEDMHDYWKKKYLKKNITIKSKGKEYIVEVVGSTRKLDTKQFTEYYEKIERDILEAGFTTPPMEVLETFSHLL